MLDGRLPVEAETTLNVQLNYGKSSTAGSGPDAWVDTKKRSSTIFARASAMTCSERGALRKLAAVWVGDRKEAERPNIH